MNDSIIKISNVKKSFGKRVLLENINFEVQKDEIIGFLGFSGCGKTTLLNILCGFDKPDEGKILYRIDKKGKQEEVSILNISGKIRRLIGFASQRTSLYKELSVIENLKYFASLYSIKKIRDERIKFLLKTFELTESKKVLARHLSEGMKKRLDIACALIHQPKILILDEPTVNLDFRLQEEFLDYIRKINKLNITVLFVSHDINELTVLCDRIVMINKTCKITSAKHNIKSVYSAFVESETELKSEKEEKTK